MSKIELTPSPEPLQHPDTLRVDLAKKTADADFTRITFIDKDTKQIVHYVPALDVSSYGETESKALEMLQFILQDYFDWLLDLSYKKLHKQLQDLGFKQTFMKNKEFSKIFVDEHGQLQHLNAVENTIKRTSLSLAA